MSFLSFRVGSGRETITVLAFYVESLLESFLFRVERTVSLTWMELAELIRNTKKF
jgi:hypothetical protein